jgi:hypothetical protein
VGEVSQNPDAIGRNNRSFDAVLAAKVLPGIRNAKAGLPWDALAESHSASAIGEPEAGIRFVAND